jgi:GrpB-like predicted nucleotidyltransferase (UPF0157 family)
LSDERPLDGDVEMSALRRADTTNFRQPLPFEIHYSAEWKEAIRGDRVDFTSNRTDPELAAYCTAVRARGVCLKGEPITAVFGPVPPQANRDAVLYDLAWILQDDRILESPIYGVLNSSRVLALEADGWDRVWSKEEGGEWALANLPEQHRPIVAQALACYRSPEPISPDERRTHGHDWDEQALHAFRDYVQGSVLPADALGLTKGQVRLAEPDPRWPAAFEYLAAVLRASLGESAAAIEHVGSTAVAGLPAKPILDMAVHLAPCADVDHVIEALEEQGYEFRGDQGNEGGLLFVLEDQPAHRVAHVHAVRSGDPQWQRYVAVRDRLRSDPIARDAYRALKRQLADQHAGDRGAYTDGKSKFLAVVVVPKASWLHPNLAVQRSPIDGSGLFALRPIEKGEVCALVGGRVLTDEQFAQFVAGRDRWSAAAIDEGLNVVQADEDPLARGNHSCDPNLWMADAITVIARRPIEAGEEATIDYALVTVDEHWHMACRCGSSLCREVVTGSDWKRRDLQQRYADHFATFINRRIRIGRPAT